MMKIDLKKLWIKLTIPFLRRLMKEVEPDVSYYEWKKLCKEFKQVTGEDYVR